MTRLSPRRIVAFLAVGAALLVAIALLAVFLWLPWNPFEGSVSSLPALLPDDVDAAARIDAARVGASPLAERLWSHEVTRRARRELGLKRRVLDPLAAVEARLADATLGLGSPPSIRRDFFGREVVVGLRDEDVLVVSRLTVRARAVEAVRGLSPDELERMRLALDGDLVVFEGDAARPLYLARHLDALLLSTSRAMIVAAVRRARAGAAPGRAGAALEPREPDAVHVRLWLDPAATAEARPDAGRPTSSGDFWRSLAPPDRLAPVTADLHFLGDDVLQITVEGAYAGDPPAAVARLEAAVAHPVALQGEAHRFANDEVFAICGIGVTAAHALETLIAAQPPSRQQLVTDLLAERDETVATVAARLATHLRDGAGTVVARLREAEDLDLDTWEGGAIEPIPATLLVFELADPENPAPLLADLRREARTLFDSPLRDAEPAAGGADVYRLESHRFGGELALLRPAFAVVDGRLVFCTHEGYLERALARRAEAGRGPPPSGSDQTAVVRLTGAALRRYVDDQRWDAAERASFHDWRRERQQIRRELDRSGVPMTPEERARHEETRILERVRRRNEVEFPRAIEEYRRRWSPLELLRAVDLRIAARSDGSRFHVEARVEIGP